MATAAAYAIGSAICGGWGTDPDPEEGVGAASEGDELPGGAGAAASGVRWSLPPPVSRATTTAMARRTATAEAPIAMRLLAGQPAPYEDGEKKEKRCRITGPATPDC
ncbi:hypothetical protein GCM10010264_20840 [Streptomyces globisporus]|nr:hypothetical protein GCM10010264_20840 [Streptomyces globisporus]